MKRSRPSKKAPADFSKKKQKVGKAKRRAENATNVSFKTRSVVIPTQLEQPEEPTTHRKLPLQTLLNHLNHYRPSVRCDALLGLRDLFQAHPKLLLPNLGKVVNLAFVTTADAECSVRHALCTLLKGVLSRVSSEQLEPFFQVLVAHLACGLTHINDQIQLDTLKVFDIVLAYFPRLFIPHASALLPLLAGLLTRQQTKLTAMKKAFALATIPNSELSIKSSRLEVFTQLSKFVGVLVEHLDADSGTTTAGSGKLAQAPVVDTLNRRVLIGQDGAPMPALSTLSDFSSPVPQVSILATHGIQLPQGAFLPSSLPRAYLSDHSPLLASQDPNAYLARDIIFPDQSQLLEFVQSLISLLLECWMECSPSLRSRGSIGTIKPDTLVMMETILNLIYLVLKLVQRVDETVSGFSGRPRLMVTLCRKFSRDFRRLILPHFPVTMNYTVPLIFLLLFTGATFPFLHTKTLKELSSFFSSLVECSGITAGSSHLTTPCLNYIGEALPLLVDLFQRYRISEEIQSEFFGGVLSLYRACHPQSTAKQAVVAAFCELLAQNPQHSQAKCRYLYSKFLLPWIQSLPNLFIQLGTSSPETSSLVISSIVSTATLGLQHPDQLLEAFHHMLGPDSITASLPPHTQRKVLELIWHLPSLGQSELSLLAHCVSSSSSSQPSPGSGASSSQPSPGSGASSSSQPSPGSGGYDSTVVIYLIQIVHHKLTYSQQSSAAAVSSCTVPLYLSFMLSVVIGYTLDELSAINSAGMEVEGSESSREEPRLSPKLVPPPSEHFLLEDRIHIIEGVCECLQSNSFSEQVLELLQPALLHTMENLQSLPMDSAAGLLKLACSLSGEGTVPDQLVPLFGKLCLSILGALETGDPLPADHPLVKWSSELTNQLLTSSREVVCGLFKQFAVTVQANPHSPKLIESLINLLDNPAVNGPLTQCKEVICSTVIPIMELLQVEDVLKQQLALSAAKFRTTS